MASGFVKLPNPTDSAATASTVVVRDANGNANFAALNMLHTAGGHNNVGMGGNASTGESIALFMSRNQADDHVIQIDNDNSSTIATAGIQATVNGESQGWVLKAYNSGSGLAVASNRSMMYNFGGGGITISGGGSGDVWIAAGGYANPGNVVCTFNTDQSMTSNGGVIIATTAARPTAGASYRGMLWVTQGAGGVADKISVCLKSAANTYSWVDVVSG